jgi:C1A family cysteine protease
VRAPSGPDWGENGNGWLPYRYVTDRLAADFWALLRPDWLAGGDFTAPL